MNRREFFSAAALIVPATITLNTTGQWPKPEPEPQPKSGRFTLVLDIPPPYAVTTFFHANSRMSHNEAVLVRQTMSNLDFNANQIDFSCSTWDLVEISKVNFRLYIKNQVGLPDYPVTDMFAYADDPKRPPIQMETFVGLTAYDPDQPERLLWKAELILRRYNLLCYPRYDVQTYDFEVLQTLPVTRPG